MVETTIGIVAGLIVTIVISRYYYRLSVRHRLSVYVLQAFQVMSDVDPDIRKDFTVEFHRSPVKNLTILELLIVNEGTHPIRDCAEPLAVQLPADVGLLDVTVPYVHPEGRRVLPEIKEDRSFEYRFSILNPREYFLTKIIADGFIDLDELSITIAADNLPPRLKPEVNDRIETSNHTFIALFINIAGVAVCVFYVLYLVSLLSLVRHTDKSDLPAWLNPPLPYPIPMIVVIIIITGISIAMAGIGFALAIVFGGTFPPSRRFPLPQAVRGNDQPIRAGLGLLLERDKDQPERG